MKRVAFFILLALPQIVWARPPEVPLPPADVVAKMSIPPTRTKPDVRKKEIDRSVAVGKVVVLNFWAMWCHWCVGELPDFVQVEEKYRARGVVFLGITDDDFQRLEQGEVSPDATLQTKLKNFAAAKKLAYPILMDSAFVKAHYPHAGLPTTYVIDRQGTVREILETTNAATLEKIVAPLL
ncbi:MAG: TlpA family protein disulfide reductase [Verrucomicrobiota bacterium]|nr:TlpA family protein disulfide reductase [Verrucomicrobiota bacterium]